MPDVTDTEFVVTSYVNNHYYGTSYSSYQANGSTYYTFAANLNERWVDVDNDGWFDYGLRDEGQGHWSTFHGFVWEGDTTAPPREPSGPKMDELSPENSVAGPGLLVSNGETSHADDASSYQGDVNLHPTMIESQQDGWIL